MRCQLCGHSFDASGLACHTACPMGERCSLICCPRCGYQVVDESKSRLATALRRLWPSNDRQERPRQVRPQPEDSVPLSHLPVGGSAEIRRMADLSPTRLARLSALGMVPGRRVALLQRRPAAVIRVGETELALGSEMLDQIWVRLQIDDAVEEGSTDPSRSLASQAVDAAPVAKPTGKAYHFPLGYLRAFVILLVVAHHAAIGYHTVPDKAAASSLAEHMLSMRAISPVVDGQRSGLLTLFATFNETFFMTLLFLLSGLFVWGSLQRKGGVDFLRVRLIRLGLPLLAMVFLRPLTHYPTYLQSGGSGGWSDYWQQWSALPWRGGPIWFLEVLLAFNVVVALFAGLKLDGNNRFRRLLSDLAHRPFRFYLLLLLLSALAYIPITAAIGSFHWLQIGPAQIEMNRLPLYAVYFLAGVALGAYGIDRSFLAAESELARRWAIWSLAALVVFAVYLALLLGGGDALLVGFLYTFSGATISFAFLALFLRFAGTQRRAFDSLDRNSYGIYVIHYGIVSWLLFAALGTALPAMAKWLVVFPVALALCWAMTAAIRRIPGLAKVI